MVAFCRPQRPNKPLKLSGRTDVVQVRSAPFGSLRFAPGPGRGRLRRPRRDASQLSAISVRRTKAMATRKPTRKHMQAGDLLKTSPVEGYWGCAVVLTHRGKTEEFAPMCHIALTQLVLRHDYAFEELDVASLEVLEFDRQIRIGPNEYASLRRETCIGIYASRLNANVVLVGTADPGQIYPAAPSWDVGDGTGNGWPLCGPVSASLGSEAVIAWRRVHDRVQWEADVAASRKATEATLRADSRRNRWAT